MKYKRLEKIISYVKPNQSVIDVGTDHAFVPIFLFKKGISNKILAIDSHKNPLEIAKKNIDNEDLTGKIELLLSNGFEKVKDLNNYDVSIIAGIGGSNIVQILSTPNEKQQKFNGELILHPTNNLSKVRKFLHKNFYKIIDEVIVNENKQNSVIIYAKKKRIRMRSLFLTNSNLFVGPILKRKFKEDEIIRSYFNSKKDFYQYIYKKSNKKEYLSKYKIIQKMNYDYEKMIKNKQRK